MGKLKSKDVETIRSGTKDFKKMKDLFASYGYDITKEEIAFGCIMEKKKLIVINDDIFKKMSSDEQMIVMAHEMVHLVDGIKDEEKTDRKALTYLSKKQQKILKELWQSRHGHEYK